MSFHSYRWPALVLFLLVVQPGGKCRADVEDQLFGKFKNQNQTAATKLKHEIVENLARAKSPGHQDPVGNLKRLEDNLARLFEDTHLPGEERRSLISRVQTCLGELRKKVAEENRKKNPPPPEKTLVARTPKDESGKESWRPKRIMVDPILTINPTFMATPVVTGDRRYVRIGVGASFVAPTLGPMIPLQFAVPTVLYGPGRGFTVGPPERIFQIFLP